MVVVGWTTGMTGAGGGATEVVSAGGGADAVAVTSVVVGVDDTDVLEVELAVAAICVFGVASRVCWSVVVGGDPCCGSGVVGGAVGGAGPTGLGGIGAACRMA